MASKRLGKGTLTNSLATVYTVPGAVSAAIKALTVCNKTSGTVNFSMTLAGTFVIYLHNIAAYDTITIPFLDQILNTTETIQMQAGANSAIDYYISGSEF
jgi:hypothetical protein